MSLGQVYYEPRSKPLNSNGAPLPGGTLTFYLSGTTTLASVYQDVALTIPLANPVTADSSGLFPVIYTDPAVLYRVILKNSLGVTLEDNDFWTGLTTATVMYGPAKADVFTGDGVTTSFTLSSAPGGTANTDVSMDGATLLPTTDYTISGTNMSLTNAPASGQKLLARYGVPVAAGFATPYYGVTTAETTAAVTPTDYSIQGTESFAYIGRYGYNLVTALSVASTNLFTIYIDRPVTLAANATVLSTTTLVFIGNGSISVSNTFTLTVQGPVVALGLAQASIFIGAGTTTISSGAINGITIIGGASIIGNIVGTTSTQTVGDNTTKLANTAFVQAYIPAKLSTATGTAPSYAARAYGQFSGTSPSTTNCANIASISKVSTGIYLITFTTPMSNSNYAVAGTCLDNNGATSCIVVGLDSSYTRTASTFRLTCNVANGGRTDEADINFVVFGN